MELRIFLLTLGLGNQRFSTWFFSNVPPYTFYHLNASESYIFIWEHKLQSTQKLVGGVYCLAEKNENYAAGAQTLCPLQGLIQYAVCLPEWRKRK